MLAPLPLLTPRPLLFAAWLALAAGCAREPPATASDDVVLEPVEARGDTTNAARVAPVGPCEKLSILQNGKDVAAADGVFRLARARFIVRYRGEETEPGIAVSPTRDLVDTLRRRGRKQVWGSGGDWLAFTPNDLPLTREFQLFVDDRARSRFAAVIGGDEYVELLRTLVAKEPGIDTATYVPKAAGFEREEPGDGYVFDVRTIAQQPVEQSPFTHLFIAYFGTVDRFAPPGGEPDRWQGLLKLNWGACLVAFEE